MNSTLDRYNNGFDPNAVKDINEINEKLKKETNKEELMKQNHRMAGTTWTNAQDT